MQVTNLDKVREALETLLVSDGSWDCSEDVISAVGQRLPAALSALSAHEEEVRELVAIAEKFATGAVGHDDFDRLTAALDKVKE